MGAGVRSPLLSRKSRCCLSIKRRYKYAVVSSKQIVLYLIWIGVFYIVEMSLPRSLIHLKEEKLLDYISFCSLLIYFLFPLFGYIGEKWTRYYLIITGVIIICIPALFIEIMVLTYGSLFFDTHRTFALILVTYVAIVFLLGQGMLGPNLVQFGTDQIQSAPSQELASYARWCVFVIFLADIISDATRSIQYAFPKATYLFYILAAFFAVLTMGSALVGLCFKYFLIIEPPSNSDPLKLIWKVMKYAWKHKYPERRSSFTYSDGLPSRLDFGKKRYGGPFTTDEVEDVKSFWHVLAVILSSTILSNFSIVTPYSYRMWDGNVSSSVTERVLVNTNSSHLLVLIIPLFQFVILPFFPCCIPSMLKRIWIGLVLKFLSFLMATITNHLLSEGHFRILLILAGIANGTGTAVMTVSSLEFIFAQAPCCMQGVLVGFWNIQFATEGLLFSFWMPRFIVFSSVITGIIFLSLIVFSIVLYRYKYRVRNEPSDINVRAIIEEIFERDLEEAKNDCSSDIVISTEQ